MKKAKRESNLKYSRSKKGIATRKKYEKSNKCKLLRAECRKDPKNLKQQNKRHKQYLKLNPKEHKKHKVRMLAANTLDIPRGYLCEECNKALAVERHHEDYNKPLEVDLLCLSCHKIKKETKEVLENEV